MKLDAHQHFWNYEANPHEYGWMDEASSSLRRNFGPDDLAPLMAEQCYVGTIAVQAREVPRETDELIGLATRNSFIKGVVGWLDLCSPQVDRALERYSAQPLLKGLRMLIHDHADVQFAMSYEHVRGVSLLERHGLTYDLLLKPEHLAAAIQLVDRLPRQKFVVDHMAKPNLQGDDKDVWQVGMKEIARRPNVWCKLSGAATFPGAAADWQENAVEYLAFVVDAFGPSRCMIGSDWPVSTTAANYATVMQFVEDWCERLSITEKLTILGGACAEFYGIDEYPQDQASST